MKFCLNKWMKSILATSLLMGASVLQAELMLHEQVLVDTYAGGNQDTAGGYSVAIDGEWAFTSMTHEDGASGEPGCQVFVYKWDPITNLWGDGGMDGKTNPPTQATTVTAGKEYITLSYTGGACKSSPNRQFGYSISTDNGMVAIGAPTAALDSQESYGMVYFFKFDESNITDGVAGPVWNDPDNRAGWERIGTVEIPMDYNNTTPSDNGELVVDKQDDSGYGYDVSVRYNEGTESAILIIGAPLYDAVEGNDTNEGKVYAWYWSDVDQNFTLIDGQIGENVGDQVGTAVTSNGFEMMASAPYFDGNLSATEQGPGSDNGAVYLFGYNLVDHNFTLEHRFESGVVIDPPAPPQFALPYLLPDFHLGITLSYLDDIIALGGIDSFVIQHYHHPVHGTMSLESIKKGTNEGATTQSSGTTVINLAVKGDIAADIDGSFNVYFDKYALSDPIGDPDVTFSKIEDNYGRDISLSLPRLMVNGDHNTTDRVAYAYHPTCGLGGKLVENQFKMIGLQCKVTKDQAGLIEAGIAEIFGSENPADPGKLGEYGTNWMMWEQNTTSHNYSGRSVDYHQMDENDTMKVGLGYWIIADTNQSYRVDNTGLSGNPLYGHNPVKKADLLSRSTVGAVTVLDETIGLDGVMGEENATGRVGGIDADYRVMLSNPLKVPTVWGDAVFGVNSLNSVVDVNMSVYFEDGSPTAYIDDPVYGYGAYKAVNGTPGFTDTMNAGQGFFIMLSGQFWSDYLNDTDIADLNLAEAKF